MPTKRLTPRNAVATALLFTVIVTATVTFAAKPGENGLLKMFDRMPADCRPIQNKWPLDRMSAAQQWMWKRGDVRCRMDVPIMTINAVHSPNPQYPGREWMVKIRIDPESFPFEGVDVYPEIAVAPMVAEDDVAVWVTKDVAERAQKELHRHSRIEIEGMVTRPRLTGDGGKGATLRVFVRDPKVDLFPTGAKKDSRKKP